ASARTSPQAPVSSARTPAAAARRHRAGRRLGCCSPSKASGTFSDHPNESFVTSELPSLTAAQEPETAPAGPQRGLARPASRGAGVRAPREWRAGVGPALTALQSTSVNAVPPVGVEPTQSTLLGSLPLPVGLRGRRNHTRGTAMAER